MHEGETRVPEEALAGPGIYRDVSHYAMQLAPFLATFGRAQVYPLTIEAYEADRAGQYRALLSWLGVDCAFVPNDMTRRQHERPGEIWAPRTPALARWMNRHAVFDIPERTTSLTGQWARALLMRKLDTRAVDLSNVRRALRRAMTPEVADLERLLGRALPEWPR